MKGPTQSILVREKEKVAGIWVNADAAALSSAPSFYAIASSRPIERIVDERTRAIYELGLDSLQLSPGSSAPTAVAAAVPAAGWSTSSAAPACITRRRARSRSPTACCTARG